MLLLGGINGWDIRGCVCVCLLLEVVCVCLLLEIVCVYIIRDSVCVYYYMPCVYIIICCVCLLLYAVCVIPFIGYVYAFLKMHFSRGNLCLASMVLCYRMHLRDRQGIIGKCCTSKLNGLHEHLCGRCLPIVAMPCRGDLNTRTGIFGKVQN